MRLLTITAACAVFAIGCASTNGFEVVAMEGGGGTPYVRLDDSYLARKLSVETAAVRREPSGFASAQVRVRNTKSEDLQIQYKFTFCDNDGMEVQPGARAWEVITIHGGESVPLSAVAPDASVSRFVVRVRRVQ